MRIPRFGGSDGLGTNMTPMIDVVFLLIIFFLLSSHLARREHDLPLKLPTASSSDEPDAARERVTLNVTARGELMLGSARVDADQLLSRFAAAVSKEGSDLEVRIRADQAVPYQHVAPILKAAADCGIWNVQFAVTEQEGP